jgi:outer membrane protein TolC
MLTSLNLRLDLMNQRGIVADSWRQIKYAGDDLKSILNISASQRVSTRADVNRAFDFTFDESETRVNASFDAPFNRFAQRNNFRQSLINYQASLRQLMQLEDSVKLDVRDDLRSLALDKEQYAIEVASAALAYERVVSVLLELRLGIGRVATRDFLEAQNAYISSLSNVASRHIGYIIDRTQLFLDLELLTVGDDGFWHELYDEKYQPEPYYQLPPYAAPAYGELVPGLWYSRQLRRMEQAPTGDSGVHHVPQPQALPE